jgi:hypothetical protein
LFDFEKSLLFFFGQGACWLNFLFSRRKNRALAEQSRSKSRNLSEHHQTTTTTTLTKSVDKTKSISSQPINKMRTNPNNAAANAAATKQLFNELKSVTDSLKSNQQQSSEPVCPPPMPARAPAKVAPVPAEAKSAALLRQLHRIVCNQSWSLRHVQEPVVQHRILVVNSGAKKSSAQSAPARPAKKVMCASATRQFPFRHVEPRVKKSPVVGVREAWMRLSLRAISRSEFTLKPTKTRVAPRGFVVVADKKTSFASMIPTGPVQLNHVETRVKQSPVVGVREAWTRLALRAISRSEFSLKPTPETRVTHNIVVMGGNDNKKSDASESNAAILRRNAPLLAQLANGGADAFEAVRLFGTLDENSRKLVIALLKL